MLLSIDATMSLPWLISATTWSNARLSDPESLGQALCRARNFPTNLNPIKRPSRREGLFSYIVKIFRHPTLLEFF